MLQGVPFVTQRPVVVEMRHPPVHCAAGVDGWHVEHVLDDTSQPHNVLVALYVQLNKSPKLVQLNRRDRLEEAESDNDADRVKLCDIDSEALGVAPGDKDILLESVGENEAPVSDTSNDGDADWEAVAVGEPEWLRVLVLPAGSTTAWPSKSMIIAMSSVATNTLRGGDNGHLDRAADDVPRRDALDRL